MQTTIRPLLLEIGYQRVMLVRHARQHALPVLVRGDVWIRVCAAAVRRNSAIEAIATTAACGFF
jgi:hypothetical protein